MCHSRSERSSSQRREVTLHLVLSDTAHCSPVDLWSMSLNGKTKRRICKLVLPQNTLFQIITRTFIYKHTGGRAKHSNAQTQRSIILQQSQYISSQVQSQSHTPQYRNRTRQVSTTLLHTPSFGEARPER